MGVFYTNYMQSGGYTWEDGNYARILHKGNTIRFQRTTASHSEGFSHTALQNSLTYERWIPFVNQVVDPTNFGTSNWTRNSCIIESDGQTFSDGSGVNVQHFVQQTGFTFTEAEWVVSFQVQTENIPEVLVWASDNTGGTYYSVFNVDDGTVQFTGFGSGGGNHANITDLGDGVYECTIYFTANPTTNGNIRLYSALNNNDNVYNGANRKMKILRAVVHESQATAYLLPIEDDTTVSCAAIAGHNLGNSHGRVTFERRAGGPQLLDFTEAFNASSWNLSNATVKDYDATAGIGPDGSSRASELTENTNFSAHWVNQNIAVNQSTNYRISVFVKKGSGDRDLRVRAADNIGFLDDIIVDVSAGALTNFAVNGSHTISNYGNGWYRVSFYVTTRVGATSMSVSFRLWNGADGYTGNGSSSVFLWGPQVTAGTPLVTYIKEPAQVSSYRALLNPIVAEDNSPIMGFFIPSTATQNNYAIRIDRAVLPEVAVFWVGNSLKMERPLYGGHSPLHLARQTVMRSNYSETGEFLGRTRQRLYNTTSFAWNNLSAAWVRENWYPFQKAMETDPFFIAWRPETFSEAGFCQVDSIPIPQNTGVRDLMSVEMTVRGLGYD